MNNRAMLRFFTILAVSLLLGVSSLLGQARSAVYLKNGTILYGSILQSKEDGSVLQLRAASGAVKDIPMNTVLRIENIGSNKSDKTVQPISPSRLEPKPKDEPQQPMQITPPPKDETTEAQTILIQTPTLESRPTALTAQRSTGITTHWSLGMFVPLYSPSMQNIIDRLAAGASHLPIVIDAPGVYLQAGDDMLVGTNINLIFDVYQTGTGSLSYSHILITVGTMYFLEDKIGNGFFLRGEVGVAYSGRNAISELPSEHWFGGGALGGFGYALPVGTAGALTLSLHATVRSLAQDNVGGVAFSIGWLL
jgi:hypothetical protein